MDFDPELLALLYRLREQRFTVFTGLYKTPQWIRSKKIACEMQGGVLIGSTNTGIHTLLGYGSHRREGQTRSPFVGARQRYVPLISVRFF
ncbi:hypothetical protein D3C71_1015550 [compost metagenome]